jgi:hypothetical protein
MLNINKHSVEHEQFIKMLTGFGCFIFQPPYSKITSGPTRRPDQYVSTCKDLDQYIGKYQTVARLKDTFVANAQYKECKFDDNIQTNEKCELGKTVGLFTFF